MVRLIFADDESKIRLVLDKIIDWDGLGIEKICSCEDGDELVRMVLTHKPDIVLSDMRMPGLSGNKLLKKIREVDKNVKLIIISGYDDFEYLKQSVVSGAEDYLLKPVDKDALNEVLKNAIQKIEAGKISTTQIKKEISSKLFDSIINESVRLEKFVGLMDIEEDDKLHLAYVCNWNKEFGKEKVYRKIEAFLSGTELKGGVMLKDTSNNGNFACVFKNWNTDDVTNYLEQLRLNVQNSCDVMSFIGFSRAETHYTQLPLRIKEAKAILNSQSANKPSLKLKISNVASEGTLDIVMGMIQNVGRQSDIKSLYNYLIALYGEVCQDDFDISIGDSKHIQEEVLYEIKSIYKKSEQSDKYVLVNKLEIELKNYVTLKLILHAISGAIEMFEQSEARNTQTKSDLALKIREYIDSHVCDKISLDDLSSTLYLNKEYISRTFKKHYGVSVFDYHDSKKIARSNELLVMGKTISEVCDEIGYYDVSHFYKKYKKIMGYNPKKFKG